MVELAGKSFFVTGGTGFVGSHILRALIKNKATVRALYRNGADFSLLADIREKIDWVEGDLLDVQTLEELVQKEHTIIHAAAMVSFHAKDKALLMKTNVEGTANLVNVCLQNQVKKFCFISSIASLGRSKDLLIDENSLWEESNHNSQYAISKFLAEREVFRGQAEGLETVVLNPSIIIGAGNWNRSSLQLFDYVQKEHKYFPPGIINVVDVRDVVKALFVLLDKPLAYGQRFVLNGASLPYKDFFSLIAQKLSVKAPYQPLSKWKIQMALFLTKIQAIFSSKRPLITKETARTSFNKYIYRADLIKDTYHFSFEPLEESIAWACAFQQNKQNLSLLDSSSLLSWQAN